MTCAQHRWRIRVVLACLAVACGLPRVASAYAGANEHASGGQAEPSRAEREADRFLPEVKVGFDGVGKADRWLPVQVVVANDGSPLSGEVRLAMRPAIAGPSVAYS